MGLVTEAIKRMFSRNTTNAASQSGARVPIVNVNGDPIGNDSLANLASVLGVLPLNNTIPSDSNILELSEGIWIKGSSSTNLSGLPDGASGNACVAVLCQRNGPRTFIIYATSTKLFYCCQVGSGTASWVTVV